MASLPAPAQVSGKDNAVYEAYYIQMDPNGLGNIEAMDAAKFLKKSGLSDVVLSRIWDLSDPKGKGCLDKAGFFVALKLVALAQAGSDINMRNIFMATANPPKVGEIPKIIPQAIQTLPAASTDWSMKPGDKMRYEQLFESLQPVNGMIAGNKVKGVLMESKLPLETLGKIWDLADQDKDGNLDQHEFTVAMHLVYQALDKRAVPTSLPTELQKPKPSDGLVNINETLVDEGFVANFPTDIAPPPVPPLPGYMTSSQRSRATSNIPSIPFKSADPSSSMINPSAPTYDWVVTPADRERFELFFRESDKDKDGLVSGLEVKHVFLQSGVPQNCLAHICKKSSKSDGEDYADEKESTTVNLMHNIQRDGSGSSKCSSGTSSIYEYRYEDLMKERQQTSNIESKDSASEIDLTAKRFLLQLKSLKETQRIIAEKLVSDVMFYGKLGKLKDTSLLMVDGPMHMIMSENYNPLNKNNNN